MFDSLSNRLLEVLRKKSGFTLAEVLITLAIIGVVAALTIPTLMSNIQTEQFRVGLKKSYSTLTQAVNGIYADNSAIDTSTADNFVNELATRISIQKTGTWGVITTLPANFNYHCYKNNSGTCADILKRPNMNGNKAFITNDGVLFIFGNDVWSNNSGLYPNCDGTNWHAKINPADTLGQNNVCASFFVDLNGDKNPNQFGMDMHYIYIIKQNNTYYVRPAGANINANCATDLPDNYNGSLHCTQRMLLDMTMP